MKKAAPLIFVLILFAGIIILFKSMGSDSREIPDTRGTGLESPTDEEFDKLAAAFHREIGTYGGILQLASLTEPKTLNVHLSQETSTGAFVGYLFEGLMDLDPVTNEVIPHLAKRWEHSEDYYEWTFYLRDDVTWFDGEKFTAADVEFTLNDVIYNDEIPSNAKSGLKIEMKNPETGDVTLKNIKVEVIDDYTIKFILPDLFAPVLRQLTFSIFPKHILKKYVDDGTFNDQWGVDTDPRLIIGTGAFKLVEYKPGEGARLERNPNYWKKDAAGNALPYLDGIHIQIKQSEETILMAFQAGEIDTYGVPGDKLKILLAAEKEKKEKNEEVNFKIFMLGPAFGSQFLVFNVNEGENNGKPFVKEFQRKWFEGENGRKFRWALSYVLDRDAMVEIAANGLGYPQWGLMSPSSRWYHDGVTEHITKYSKEKAEELLDEIGFIDRDNDGIREDASPKHHPIEFRLTTSSEGDVRTKLCEMIKEAFEGIGLKVNYRPVPFNELVKSLTDEYDWDAILIGLTGGGDPHSGANIWRTSGNLHMWYPHQETPATAWEEEIDRLFREGAREMDEDKRREIYNEFQMIIAYQKPMIYTYLAERINAFHKRLGNVTPTKFYTYDASFLYILDDQDQE